MTRSYAQEAARGIRYVSEPGAPVNLGQLGICATVRVSVRHAVAAKSTAQEAREAKEAAAAWLKAHSCSVCGAVEPKPCAFAGCPISYADKQRAA